MKKTPDWLPGFTEDTISAVQRGRDDAGEALLRILQEVRDGNPSRAREMAGDVRLNLGTSEYFGLQGEKESTQLTVLIDSGRFDPQLCDRLKEALRNQRR